MERAMVFLLSDAYWVDCIKAGEVNAVADVTKKRENINFIVILFFP